MISMFISSFLGSRLYAMSPACRLVAKLLTERCLVCSIWQTFFSSSLTVSMTERFLSIILSCRLISEFFMFFLIFVIRCMSSTKSRLKRSWLTYPLSAKSFPNGLSANRLSFSDLRSSSLSAMSVHCMISVLSLMTRCSFRP